MTCGFPRDNRRYGDCDVVVIVLRTAVTIIFNRMRVVWRRTAGHPSP